MALGGGNDRAAVGGDSGRVGSRYGALCTEDGSARWAFKGDALRWMGSAPTNAVPAPVGYVEGGRATRAATSREQPTTPT